MGNAGGVGRIRLGHVAAFVVGLALIAGGLALGAAPYADRRAFDRAPYCATPPSAGPSRCVERVPMTVITRSTYTTQDPDPPDPNWPPPPPPPQPPTGPFGMASRPAKGPRVEAASTTTHYQLTVRTADGQRHRFDVGHGIYKVAKPGVTGTAAMWRGRLVRLRIGSHSDDVWSYSRLEISWLIVWTGVMLIVGLALPLAAPPFGLAVAGWFLGVMPPVSLFIRVPLVSAVPILIAAATLLLRVRVTARWRR